jgi:hypothetical protein
MQYQTLS